MSYLGGNKQMLRSRTVRAIELHSVRELGLERDKSKGRNLKMN